MLFAIGTFLPAAAFAVSVQVYPTITNAHGGTKFAKDLTVCIDQGSFHRCEAGVPTFQLPTDETYAVSAVEMSGYAYTLDAGCSGVPAVEKIVCNIAWSDGAPIVQPAPQPVVAPVVGITAPVIPFDVTGVEMTQEERIAELQKQIIELYKILIALLQKRLAEAQ